MLDLFLKREAPGLFQGTIEYPTKDWIIRNSEINLNRVLEYYNNRRYRVVNNSNMLARLLDTCCPDIHLDLVEFYAHVKASALYLSKRFGITSTIHKGEFLHNVLQNGASEAYIYTNYEYNLFGSVDEYLQLSSVRTICNPNMDIDYSLSYFQTNTTTENDLYFYEIDPILMCLQYRAWALRQEKYSAPMDRNAFIAMIVIPNMLLQTANLAIWNRFKYMAAGNSFTNKFVNKHPFYITTYDNKLNDILTMAIKKNKQQPYAIHRIINTLPAYGGGDLIDSLILNNKVYTSQSYWFLWMSRVDDILFILDFLGKRGATKNKALITKLPWLITTLYNRITVPPNSTPPSVLEAYLDKLDKIKILARSLS